MQSLKARIARQFPNAMFVLMPLYAGIVAVLDRARRLRYSVHLVFALHAHAYFFAALVLGEVVEFAEAFSEPLADFGDRVVVAWILAYFPLAMRRVYGGRWWTTGLRALTLGALYATAALTACVIAVVGYLYSMGR